MPIELKTIKQGNGHRPQSGNKVTVSYECFLQNGTRVDSSKARERPFQFVLGLGQVIKGWEEGIVQMSVGEVAVLTCPPEYAYGKQTMSNGLIPANSTLVFEVQLLSFK